jgi:phosphatidylserine/phosphatidylglycerophosphate/cardiolipin synthase-like enzyme
MAHVRPALPIALLALVFSACTSPVPAPRQPPGLAAPAVAAPPLAVYFSPNGGATDAIVARLDAARSTVRVLAYSFTSERIADALIAAHRRGVDVQVIVDKSQRRATGSRVHTVATAGVPVFIDSAHAIQHNKVIVVDSATLITGSFNFSQSAETRNAENLLILRDAETAAIYSAEWTRHRGHATAHEAGGENI